MADEKRVSEPNVTYEVLATDLSKPIIVEREGQPFGVFLAYEEYQRLQSLAEESAQRREQAWQQLDALLASVHARDAAVNPQQIEAEITAAIQEAREQRRARRSRR
jgi:PHD/YefM family antitoxin component YafN of YafNO toxin-antitoxin module